MKKKRIIWAVVALLLLVMVIWTVWGNTTVGLTTITLTEENLPRGFDGFRIAQVSDLHNSWLWEKAIERLKEAEPDIIVITGDLVNGDPADVEVALAFAKEAIKIAGCFYVTGNHEGTMAEEDYAHLLTGLRELGVVVMEDSQTVIHCDGSYLALVGHSWGSEANLAMLSDFDGYRILLSHQPERFAEYVSANYDLVFSGHAHGGQVRLPFIGGIIAPGQGLFPQYDSGLYSDGNTDMVVSRGIGNSSFPIRFNNQPEVILLELRCG